MNRLAAESSPYLRQHADNPVDWYPWGGDAFERARRENRPVFLSVGYSACHWCHVMAHESFEDPETAAVMNEYFVCVKVDREERPDVDAVYMEAVQAVTGSGGWPMSVFLTPDQRPFFGGTYFPPVERHGTPSFRTVIAALADVWANRRDEVEEQADQLSAAIATRSHLPARTETGQDGVGSAGGVHPDLVGAAAEEAARRFDPVWGGFGPAPKFPQPALVDLALWHSLRAEGDPAARSERMATLTLDAMAAGGIHDHLGGGFARYSTDDEWLVPHFEKMLYDQAGLLRSFLHGWLVTGSADYLRVMQGIVDYVGRDLTTVGGGVCSAEDADSEGVEGRYYVWTPEQIVAAITGRSAGDGDDGTARSVAEWFGVTENANFEEGSILRRPVGEALVGPADVESGRRLLLEARRTRVRPGLDDKVLTEWNAMYASALAEAAAGTGNPEWADGAVAIAEFLCDHLLGSDGRWRRSWQAGSGAHHLAYAGDYAWLVDCFTRLGELTGLARWTRRAGDTADALMTLFGDETDGGFFTTGNDAEALIVRTKELFDGATPSANAVACLSLARLGAVTGEARYTEAAHKVVDLLGDLLPRHPTAFAHTVLAAEFLAGGCTEVVVTGDRPDLLHEVRRLWLPDAVVAWGEATPSPLWQGREGGRAYVCRDYACRLPVSDAGGLAAQLREGASVTRERERW